MDYGFPCVNCGQTIYVDDCDLADGRGKECRYCYTFNEDFYIKSKIKR